MRNILVIICLLSICISAFAGCNITEKEVDMIEDTVENTEDITEKIENVYEEISYEQINVVRAKELMDTEDNYIILDVRTEEEFAEGHIPNAILIPDFEIKNKAENILLDKNQLILVYCKSGRRSKLASEHLVEMGYTNVKEFGGIIDWPYEITNE